MLKRNFATLNEQDDQEDEWELEASASAMQRHSPPDCYTTKIDTLDQQYEVLCDTTKDLEAELEALQTTLQRLEEEKHHISTATEQSEQKYLESVEKTVALLPHREVVEMEKTPEYLTADIKLTEGLEALLSKWKDAEKERIVNRESLAKEIKSLAHQYRYNEYAIMDLNAQIEGSQAQIQMLNRDITKLNSLPVVLPVIKSDIEKYRSDIQNSMESLDKIEKESIKPYLIELSKLKISIPLHRDQINSVSERTKSFLKDLIRISDLIIKQRSYLTLISFIYQTIEYKSKLNADVRQSVTQKLEEQVCRITLQDERPNKKDDSDVTHLKRIKKLLCDFFKTKKDLKLIKKYEGELKGQWNQDMQSCLDVIAELDTLKSKLSETIHGCLGEKDDVVGVQPASYASLQDEIESRTNQLKSRISGLAQEMLDSEENMRFKKRRELFSAFYTDPDDFFELIKK
ncbi:uncharacterized protein EV154DRAFT_518385 [Mucor mucedo]|uniref:uncharacterized protein n=1 Tax=Mucor mucedo TaxID=29922 RepID=UPI002220C702|nr:uncharacterized protein EV154DRAFT_518385 [Mucor mucedo]KAI7888236.1 hypothetical protein EV154DRAFT_518385 [Mucor mucedo]